jgi:hypothetical protein
MQGAAYMALARITMRGIANELSKIGINDPVVTELAKAIRD